MKELYPFSGTGSFKDYYREENGMAVFPKELS
jgi:hypothetical protein